MTRRSLKLKQTAITLTLLISHLQHRIGNKEALRNCINTFWAHCTVYVFLCKWFECHDTDSLSLASHFWHQHHKCTRASNHRGRRVLFIMKFIKILQLPTESQLKIHLQYKCILLSKYLIVFLWDIILLYIIIYCV